MKIGCNDGKLKAKKVPTTKKNWNSCKERKINKVMNMVVIDENINDKGQMTSGKIDGMRKIDHMVWGYGTNMELTNKKKLGDMA